MTFGHQAERLQRTNLDEFFVNLSRYGITFSDERAFGQFLGIRFSSVFQSIIDLSDESIFGHEALLRPLRFGHETILPSDIFDLAKGCGDLVDFDRACRTVHMLNYMNSTADNGLLSLNVHPGLLAVVQTEHGAVFERILHYYSVPTNRVMIEIAAQPMEDTPWLWVVIENYRRHGYQVAIDFGARLDVNMNGWRVLPDTVKFSQGSIQKCVSDVAVKNKLRDVTTQCHELGLRVTVVGIEERRELDIAREIDVDFGQGFLWGWPCAKANSHCLG